MIFSKINLDYIKAAGEYKPFPTADDREAWEKLNPEIKNELVKKGEVYYNHDWPILYATSYLDYTRTGDQDRFNKMYFSRRYALGSLVIAECIEGKGRYIDDIVNGIWLICEETSWIISAHNIEPADCEDSDVIRLPDLSRKPLLCLFSLETSSLLSWTYYLLKTKLDEVTPIVCERIYLEVKKRTLDIYLERQDYWWMGFRKDEDIVLNNWVPWTSSNLLVSYLFLEKDESRKLKAFKKIVYSLDEFMKVYPTDGGCDEGPGYWKQSGASLLECIEIIQSVISSASLFEEPIVGEIGRYIYRVNIKDDKFINFADCTAKVNIPGELVFRYGKHIKDKKLMALGAKASQSSPLEIIDNPWFPMYRVINALFNYDEVNSFNADSVCIRDVWFDGIQLMAARENEDTFEGLFLAVKGGHNQESHNHNDAGQFIVYLNGEPGIIDVGVGTYNSKTFGPERYSIWTMQSSYHNLPVINGVMQMDGPSFKASEVKYSREGSSTRLEMDIAGAYPEIAGINCWKRTYEMRRNDNSYKDNSFIVIKDEFKLDSQTDDLKLFLMTSNEPVMTSGGQIVLTTRESRLIISYESYKINADYEVIELTDPNLTSIWGDRIYRIILSCNKPVICDKWTLKIFEDTY